MQKRVMAFDIETHLFGPYYMAPKPVCLTWAEQQDLKATCFCGIEVGLDNVGRWLEKALTCTELLLVGQYVAYDFSCLFAHVPSAARGIWDAYGGNRVTCTAIRERLLDIAVGEFQGHWDGGGKRVKHGYGLDDIVKRRLGREVAKGEDTWRLRYGELEGVPLEEWPEEAVEYATTDARVTMALWLEQEKRAGHIQYDMPTQYDDTRVDFALRLASAWGIETDRERVGRLWDVTCDKMEVLAAKLVKAGVVQDKPVAGSLLDERRRIPEVKKEMKIVRSLVKRHYPRGKRVPLTPTKAVSTAKEVIQECDYEPLQELVEFSGLQKAASTYISKMFAPVVHARFNGIGAASDRTSSEKPNLQNQPRLPGIRECFRARDGYVFLACDYRAQEMRTLAQSCLDICGRSKLAERFREDPRFDPHLEFAARLANVSVDEARKREDAGDAPIKKLRQESKIANFGFPGGMGAEAFVQYARGWGVRLSLAESMSLRDSWFVQWPEMRPYFEHVGNLVGQAGMGTMVIPQSGFRRGGCGYCDTANGYFQTLAAHASKSGMFEVCRRAYLERGSWLYGSRPVLFIHDEVVLETPREVGHLAAGEIEGVMEAAMQPWTPDVPASASATLMTRWSKEAERTYDGGRLVAWEG